MFLFFLLLLLSRSGCSPASVISSAGSVTGFAGSPKPSSWTGGASGSGMSTNDDKRVPSLSECESGFGWGFGLAFTSLFVSCLRRRAIASLGTCNRRSHLGHLIDFPTDPIETISLQPQIQRHLRGIAIGQRGSQCIRALSMWGACNAQIAQLGVPHTPDKTETAIGDELETNLANRSVSLPASFWSTDQDTYWSV